MTVAGATKPSHSKGRSVGAHPNRWLRTAIEHTQTLAARANTQVFDDDDDDDGRLSLGEFSCDDAVSFVALRVHSVAHCCVLEIVAHSVAPTNNVGRKSLKKWLSERSKNGANGATEIDRGKPKRTERERERRHTHTPLPASAAPVQPGELQQPTDCLD